MLKTRNLVCMSGKSVKLVTSPRSQRAELCGLRHNNFLRRFHPQKPYSTRVLHGYRPLFYQTATHHGSIIDSRNLHILSGERDRYDGIHVDLELQIPNNCDIKSFDAVLTKSLEEWREQNVLSVWIKVPIAKSHLISVAAQHGFLYHHAENEHAMLSMWLAKHTQSKLPRFATHQVGVAGCVVREDTHQVLVVKDKHRKATFWKFPGGLANLGEDISETAQREVLEETGIRTEFNGILALRQQHDQPGAFGRSDIYIICHLTPLNFDLQPCSAEIEACEWVDLFDLEQNAKNSAVTLRVAHLIRLGLEKGFNHVDMKSTEFKSVYKGLRYKLFTRSLDNEDMSSYIHSVSNYGDR